MIVAQQSSTAIRILCLLALGTATIPDSQSVERINPRDSHSPFYFLMCLIENWTLSLTRTAGFFHVFDIRMGVSFCLAKSSSLACNISVGSEFAFFASATALESVKAYGQVEYDERPRPVPPSSVYRIHREVYIGNYRP